MTRTEHIRVGVLVSCNNFRHPGLLAHSAMTVDHVSNGRLEIGLGADYTEGEHGRFGIELHAPGERRRRFREAVQIIDSLLRNETTTFEGQHYKLSGAYVRPRPVQKPRPPFTFGAHGPRMLRICAEFADTWNSFGSVEEIAERNRILDEHCADLDRDPGTLRRSYYGWSSQMEIQGLPDFWSSVDAFEEIVWRYREVGITEFVLDQPRADQFDVMERVVADVIPALRADSTA